MGIGRLAKLGRRSQFARSAGSLVVGTAAARFATLGATIGASRILIPEHFGQLTVVQAGLVLVGSAAGLGFGLAVTRQVAATRITEPDVAGRYMAAALVVAGGAGVLVTLAWLGAHRVVADFVFQSRSLDHLVAVSAAAILATVVTNTVQGCLAGLEAFRAAALSQAVQGVATAGGVLAGAGIGDVSGALLGFSLGYLVAAAFSLVLLVRETRKLSVPLSYRFSWGESRRLGTIAAPAFVASLAIAAGLLSTQVLLTQQPNGYQDLAVFNVAYRWQLAIVFVPAAFAPVLLPMMTRLRAAGELRSARALFGLNVRLTLALTLLPGVAVALAAHAILGLHGAFYQRDTTPMIILAFASTVVALNTVLSNASVSVGALRQWMVSDLVLAGVMVALAAALVAGSGATGLAIAYAAGYAATDAYLLLPLQRRLRSAPVAAAPAD